GADLLAKRGDLATQERGAVLTNLGQEFGRDVLAKKGAHFIAPDRLGGVQFEVHAAQYGCLD
ncbi:MAG: hypothetical protein QOE89_1133, partial [Pseudonocardiales bacterium]|nr:hypothetical protein [Pseudonocardiales bacterium]